MALLLGDTTRAKPPSRSGQFGRSSVHMNVERAHKQQAKLARGLLCLWRVAPTFLFLRSPCWARQAPPGPSRLPGAAARTVATFSASGPRGHGPSAVDPGHRQRHKPHDTRARHSTGPASTRIAARTVFVLPMNGWLNTPAGICIPLGDLALLWNSISQIRNSFRLLGFSGLVRKGSQKSGGSMPEFRRYFQKFGTNTASFWLSRLGSRNIAPNPEYYIQK